jgi:coenzyme Q-binding protein COQ10
MISYQTSKKVDFTSKEIFDLVMDIEKYPDFLEWVSGARIIEKQDNLVVAKLDIYFKGYNTSYVSNITTESKNDHYSINIDSRDGPFKSLRNVYTITPIDNNSSILTFDNYVEFRFKIIESLIGLTLSKNVEKIISAFEEQAKRIYGPRE